ncbi:MAG: UDP-N-acetylmuramoyl-L-alanyl-D-glutamate--2,6-diaminopimelate ligase [Candidatus Aminicenantes bacterium]|nr:UDP-N-acetylmuramoyl-L-alanyl-D-glutamate--2,6-diaminopimelate ligase [Candidatus Aminicenantes bacterium]
MKLSEVLQRVPNTIFSGPGDADISGISHDSRKMQKGFLFVAVQGEKMDGFAFIEKALQSGAEAVVSSRKKPDFFSKAWIQVSDEREALSLCSANFYSHPSKELKIVGITGTKGKTTVSYILEEILKKANFIPGVIGTISYRGPNIGISAERTTPEASDLQRMLRQMVDGGATHCIMEVSSHALELKRVTGIEFDVVVFTNLSGEHMDYHQNMDSYFAAKKKLFHAGRNRRTAIINTDDDWGKKLISDISIESISVGLQSPAMVYAEKYDFDANGTKLTAIFPSGKMTISSHLLGKPNVYNALSSLAASLALNIPTDAIKEGIAALQGVPGRFERIQNSLGIQIYVDYAHTDDALKNLLETAQDLARERIILVFGAGGDRDKTKRPRMGAIAGKLADLTILTSDNPRTESPSAIISDVEEGLIKTGPKKYIILPDRKEAIKKALSLARKDDMILVAGKGHEDYQILRDKIIPFSDKEVICEILKTKGKGNSGLG